MPAALYQCPQVHVHGVSLNFVLSRRLVRSWGSQAVHDTLAKDVAGRDFFGEWDACGVRLERSYRIIQTQVRSLCVPQCIP